MAKSAMKMRALWTVAVLAAGLVGVHTVRSEPASLKVFKAGDVLSADDLNANFAAATSGATAPYAWSAFAQARQDLGLVGGGSEGVPSTARVATFSFSSPVASQAWLTATFEMRVRNRFDYATREQCRAETLLSDTASGFGGCGDTEYCNTPGYAQTSINANLPTQEGGGTYLGMPQTVTRLLPVKQGLNTFYLLGRTDCPAVLWGAITFSAITVQNGGAATVSIP